MDDDHDQVFLKTAAIAAMQSLIEVEGKKAVEMPNGTKDKIVEVAINIACALLDRKNKLVANGEWRS